MRVHAGGLQAFFQRIGGVVIAGQTQHGTVPAEHRDVQRHVSGTAGALFNLTDMHHRHRRFGRDARSRAVPVAIQHEVADHQHPGVFERGYLYVHVWFFN
jgi:hypothetical protein